jgi:hypothetical protein
MGETQSSWGIEQFGSRRGLVGIESEEVGQLMLRVPPMQVVMG